ASHLLACATCSVQGCARTELRTVLVVTLATASVRQVRFPSLRASRDADPTSPNEMVESVSDIRSEPWNTSRMEFNSAHTEK
ncbi:MAG: hypothetical protein ABIU05_21040, partial [Nitrospirales bacterium]